MTMDQLICGCGEEKVRMHLTEKAPSTSREALFLAIAYQAAIKYNESLREISSSISAMYSESEQTGYANASRGQWRPQISQNRNFNMDWSLEAGYRNDRQLN